MRTFIALCAVVLFSSLGAAAQESSAAFETSNDTSSPAARSLSPMDRSAWQLGFGFQYQHFNVLGSKFGNHGFHTSIARFTNDWLGIEGTAVMGFGHANAVVQGRPLTNLSAKSLFLGGGPHIAIHNGSRLEPWLHFLPGVQHFRFTQTGGQLGSNSAFGFIGGGGIDYKIGPRAYWRVQLDYVGTRFSSHWQKNYSFGTGLVINF